jgi:tRNA nucleotidyltransferase/poly(A) polymerase
MEFQAIKQIKQIKEIINKEKDLYEIFQLLDNKAMLVGGCVRDFVLYQKLVEDIDIATSFKPEEVVKRLGKKFNVIPTGLKHGTVTIVGKHKYEITTLRRDAITDGRHALVEFETSWEIDAQRRDFTINALYADINGNIYDYYDGLKDLEKNLVRFIKEPEKRIKEDYLRIMRFFRFAARFGSYDQASLDACLNLCANLLQISRERITSEWLKIISGQYFWALLPKMLPMLKVVGLNTNVEKVENLSVLGMVALFWKENSLLLLSTDQKKYINNLLNLSLTNQTDAILYARKYGNQFIGDKMILEKKHFDIPTLPMFPIKGAMLQELGFVGPEIGKLLDVLYRVWLDNLGEISVDDLLKIVKLNSKSIMEE